MNARFCLVWLLALSSFHEACSQIPHKYFFNLDGKKADSSIAAFYILQQDQTNYIGSYKNGKTYFTGKISRLDTTDFSQCKFTDTCKWYYKNGNPHYINTYDEDGKLNGLSKWYFEGGSLWKELNYEKNKIENNTYAEFLEDGQRFEIFEDQFNDNSSEWDLVKDAQQEVKIENGHMVLTAKAKEGTSRYKYIKFNKEDFIIEGKMKFSKLGKGEQGGLIFGFKDWDNFNFFYVNHESVFLGTVYEGVKNYAIEDMFCSSLDENGYNTLKLISNGSDLIYTVNGTVVYKSSRSPFYGHQVGVALLGSFTLELDQLIFKQLSYSAMGNGHVAREQKDIDVKATGTGFFIHGSGIVATNYHVIENGRQILVDVLDTISASYKSYKATLLMKDADNDLAILKIVDEAYKPLFPVIEYGFATANNFELGSTAFTLGFPLALAGMGTSEVKFSDGKISAKTGYNGALNSFQTTIPVQPGNSGGPIYNLSGELIGIINSKISKADNVSYGIKNNFLINLIQSLPENINLPSSNPVQSLSFEEKIKIIKKYIVLIKVK